MGLSGLKISYMLRKSLVLWPPFEVHNPLQTFRSTILCCNIVIEDNNFVFLVGYLWLIKGNQHSHTLSKL